MAEAETTAETPAPDSPVALSGQTYEIIRKRLDASAAELRTRLELVNEARKEVFGSIETALLTTERVTTENNCIPRDMVALGDQVLLGYNVHLGLRSEMTLADVFSSYRYEDRSFHAQPLAMLENEQFRKDFQDLYKYYRATQFAQFALRPPHLFMVFRVGSAVSDIKTFKWLIQDDKLTYLDNRSDHQFGFPPQHEFTWQRTTRDQHRGGRHPHISIDERVFVETIGGDLTIKVENNTDSGEGIYAEPVDEKDQTLDDADIQYAIIGNIILLKIRPYQEQDYRYIVFNEKVQEARRIDAIADACVLLPDDHGLIFSRGYYLQSGEYKTFDINVTDTVFGRQVRAANGEDYLYVFYNQATGTYVLLSYNLISQEVSTPQICNGYSFFDNGELLSFRHHDQPEKHHAVQIWQTPYTVDQLAPPEQTDSLLYKIGNRDLVRAMAECHEVLNLLAKEDSYANLYVDLVKAATDLIDSYFWIDKEEAFNLRETLAEIRDTATGAIGEFEKVIRIRRDTAKQIAEVEQRTAKVISSVRSANFDAIGDFVHLLSELRAVRGEIIALRELRYVDLERVGELETKVREHADQLAVRCVDFLLEEESLVPYQQQVEAQHAKIDKLEKVADAKTVQEEIAAAASELEMLIEIVSNLKIDDATQRTTIIDNISAIFSRLNQTRAALKNKSSQLMATEGAAEFHAQLKLLDQSVANFLDICETPTQCEEYLTKVMIQVEELEGRFAEFDEFVLQITEKRDEVYNAFESRRLSLVEARNRRTDSLMKSGERILKGIRSRVESFETVDQIHGYFASDLMIEKVRNLIEQLTELDDSVKADDLQSRLKTVREDAVRQLKDRKELFVDGQNIIKFGRHQFSVNVQTLDLTTVRREGNLCYHLTGTNFFEEVDDEQLAATRDVWDQEVISENDSVYRAEYLAYQMLLHLGSDALPELAPFALLTPEERLTIVQRFMAPRYAEGYVKGVHDQDAEKYLAALVDLKTTIGLLSYPSPARAAATLFWQQWQDRQRKPLLEARLRGFGQITQLFSGAVSQRQCIADLQQRIDKFAGETGLFSQQLAGDAGEYLFHALAHQGHFVISREASDILRRFQEHLHTRAFSDVLADSLKELQKDRLSSYLLARDWVTAYLEENDEQTSLEYADESALLLLDGEYDESRVIHSPVSREIAGLMGSHSRIKDGQSTIRYNDFTGRLEQFSTVSVPRFQQYTARKRELVDAFRDDLRLEEFRPRVLTSFVRNQLIDTVYLPLIGDNLAKQIGAAGDAKRTDRMGLLLVISPPGYGKTTLMEYVANRLGIIFMKINGPAIGHAVTSLDPAEAPNASAREEIEKLNLALEMGDNVMIYLDDIQHCNPELLQKFISLCDATRKIEGVWKGRTRTYDLRGRKVCVVMAGNPYTESGERFQIPDMLTNRADTYNLGEIIGDNARAFELSYIENCMTSNPALARLASRDPKDIYSVVKMAEGTAEDSPEFSGNYSVDELTEMVGVMQKLLRVRNVVLKVNRAYIHSAAQADDYRTEPSFKLQGSYRNMNRIAERVSPVMNDRELETLIYSTYENDAQTLTTGAEANLLKLKELLGTITDEETKRWRDIQRTFQQNLRLRSVGGDDNFGKVIAQMSVVSDGLDTIRDAVATGVKQLAEDSQGREHVQQVVQHLGDLQTGLVGLRETINQGLDRFGEFASGPHGITTALAPETLQQITELMQQLSATTAGEQGAPAQQTIQVVNKVPRVVLGVIREQFDLMQKWLAPLTSAATAQRSDFSRLSKQLDKAMAQYQELIGKLEDSE